MNKEEVCTRIREIGIVPAIRVPSYEDAHFATDAVAKAGIPIVEITLTVPRAVELIAHVVREHRKTLVGAGTVLDIEMARQCADAGASFLTAPGLDTEIVEFAAARNLAVIPGALTPTEVVRAWKAGADFVKVFPCSLVGGEKYIRALKISLPQIPLIAAGGVNQTNAAALIVAGADAIGIRTQLIPNDAIRLRKADRINELAKRFSAFVAEGRDRLKS